VTRLRLGDALLAAVVTAVVFAGGFGLYPWYDDWMYLSAAGDALARHAPGEFIWSPLTPHWSPLAFALEIVNLRLVGWESDLFIRLAIAVLVFVGLFVFAAFARHQGSSGVGVAAGLGVLALHHINAAAFYSFDCYDQIAADLLTWTSLTLLIRASDAVGRRAWRQCAWAVGLYVPALLFKEQALTVAAGAVVIAIWASAFKPPPAARRLWIVLAVIVGISALFAFARWRAGLWFQPDGPYRLCLTCVPGNVGLLAGSLMLPVRTLDVFVALKQWPAAMRVVLPAALATVGLIWLLVAGVARNRRAKGHRLTPLYLALLAASFFPVTLLATAVELHAHTALFWFALVISSAVDGWRDRLRRAERPVKYAMAALLCGYVVALGTGLHQNRDEMRASGERSRDWRVRLHAAAAEAPRGSTILVRGLLLVKSPDDYGLYRVTLPGYLLAGTTGIAWAPPRGLVFCADSSECTGETDFVMSVDERGGVRFEERATSRK
jgi:hypothetical protein